MIRHHWAREANIVETVLTSYGAIRIMKTSQFTLSTCPKCITDI